MEVGQVSVSESPSVGAAISGVTSSVGGATGASIVLSEETLAAVNVVSGVISSVGVATGGMIGAPTVLSEEAIGALVSLSNRRFEIGAAAGASVSLVILGTIGAVVSFRDMVEETGATAGASVSLETTGIIGAAVSMMVWTEEIGAVTGASVSFVVIVTGESVTKTPLVVTGASEAEAGKGATGEEVTGDDVINEVETVSESSSRQVPEVYLLTPQMQKGCTQHATKLDDGR